ncbi:MAG TPA: hypothetical protein PK867_06645 [Pirellulales bacterium]|nr:hypothetical protein [Pirellulales bacterium]
MKVERLLGYDVRVIWPGENTDWPAARRQAYLYRRDVRSPLSTDVMVWPSAFDCRGDCPGRFERRFLQFIWHDDLWADLAILRAYCKRYFFSAAEDAFRPAMVALTLVVSGAQERSELNKLQGAVEPATLDAGWVCLGYDVSDRWLLSALTNCGHNINDGARGPSSAQWEARLNEHHLFTSIADAIAYRTFADSDVPEHSPFFVYGVWIAEDSAEAIRTFRSPNASGD